jgi:microcompartment protein CcmK/EutM
MGKSILWNSLMGVVQTQRRCVVGRRDRRRLRLEELERRVVPVATLSVGNATFNLAAGAAGFQVTRSGDLTPAVDIGYAVTAGTALAGTNYTSTAPTGVLDFASGQTTATIPLTILSNNFSEPSRTFTVDLTGVVATFGPPATFAAQQTFATGNSPTSVLEADLNGDGLPDLIVTNSSDATVGVSLNTTAPGATTLSFAAQQTFATGSDPTAVAVADLNGDGLLDLIVANDGSDTVSVLMNTTAPGATTPTFATQVTCATGTGPHAVAVADLNGDGLPDLLVANAGAGTVSVLMNTTAPGAATPTFATQQSFATGTFPTSVAVADLNGDGFPDLVVANESSDTVSVLLNTTTPDASTPSFHLQQTFATGNSPTSVVAADMNGDGLPDLVVANSGSTTVSVLFNTTAPGATTASFANQQTFATGNTPYAVVAADVNGDGRPDIVVANAGSATVSVLMNTTVPGATAASFASQQTYATGEAPGSVAVVDLNGDGLPDLIVADNTSNSVSVLVNTTAHVEATPAGVPAPVFTGAVLATGTQPIAVAVADLNGDGKPDLVIANYASGTVSVLLNTTAPGAMSPSFAAQQTFAAGSDPYSVAVADVNGDGLPDILVADSGSNEVSVLLNTTARGATTASFAAAETFATGGHPNSITTADLNGDGLLDLIVSNYVSRTVSVLLNTTTPGATTSSFATQQTFATGTGPSFVEAADVNGDGRPDLLVANYGSASVSVLLNTTTPGAATPSFAAQQTFATGRGAISLTAVDLNGDGLLDLAVANYGSGTVSVLLNTTTPGATAPSFAAQQTFAAGRGPISVAAADLNGDGRPDLIVANASSNDVSVLLNTTAAGAATFTFAAQQTFATGSRPRSVPALDVNGDGLIDLIASNDRSADVSVLLNMPAVVGTGTATGTIDSAPVVASIVLADPNPTVAASVDFSVTFSEAVTGVTAANFILSGTATSGASIGTPTTSDGGITWNVPVTTGIAGTLGLTLSDRTGIADSAGNQLYDTTTDDGSVFDPVIGPQYTIDGTTTTDVSSSLNPSAHGQSVTFTATVTNTIGGGVPTGSVTFFDGESTLGPGTALGGSGTTATWTFTTSTLALGGHSITAVYTATGNFADSTSAALSQTVNPSFQISGSVFTDLNANGALDSGEPGLAGRTVFLDLNHSGNLDAGDPSTVTDANGAFTFTNLSAGTYTVRELISYPNVATTGTAPTVVVQIVASNVSGANLGNVVYLTAYPIYPAANLFAPSPAANANTAYVQGLYHTVLDRNADQAGLASWVADLNSGETHAQVAEGFINSVEHRQNEVDYFYEALLNRAVDPGSAIWVNMLLQNGNEAAVVEGIMSSPEYTTDHTSNTNFVDSLYTQLLGRQPDEGGANNWIAELAAGATRAAVVAQFLNMPEPLQLAVDSYYAAFMHRAGDTAGVASWAQQLANGSLTFSQVALQFLDSAEFIGDAS